MLWKYFQNNFKLNNFRFVGQFISKNERNEENGLHRKFTNVFVKNLDENVDDAKLRELFQRFGEITSAVVCVFFSCKFMNIKNLSTK